MALATFEGWLSNKLVELNIDDEVFSPYIIDLLDGDNPEFQVKEVLSAILSDILDDEVVIKNTMKEILLKWSNHAEASKVDEVKDVGAELDISGKMHQIMEDKMAIFSMNKVERTEEEMRIKEALLVGFSEVADGENDDSDEEGGDGDLGLVDQAKREEAMIAPQAKKQKDKQERENQKKQGEDRKKISTGKGGKG